MKKLISCLLAAMMLLMAVSASAITFDTIKESNALNKFLDETDLATKDLALQVQAGEDAGDRAVGRAGRSAGFDCIRSGLSG